MTKGSGKLKEITIVKLRDLQRLRLRFLTVSSNSRPPNIEIGEQDSLSSTIFSNATDAGEEREQASLLVLEGRQPRGKPSAFLVHDLFRNRFTADPWLGKEP